MKNDLKLFRLEDGSYDLGISGGDFIADEGLTTTLLTSLLSDARASESEVGQAEYRGGWLPNVVFSRVNSQLGSLLWLMEQRRRTTESLNLAIDSAQKALAWLVEDGVAKTVQTTGALSRDGAELTIEITSLSGQTENIYVPLWRITANGS